MPERPALHRADPCFRRRLASLRGPLLWCAAMAVAAAPGRGLASGPASESPFPANHDRAATSPNGHTGVALGEFNVRTYRSVPAQRNRVRFKAHARIDNAQLATFRRLLNHRRIKVRDQIIIATRLVPVEDYNDPDLEKLRRRIQLRLRRTMPELKIDDIYVSDFTLTVEDT